MLNEGKKSPSESQFRNRIKMIGIDVTVALKRTRVEVHVSFTNGMKIEALGCRGTRGSDEKERPVVWPAFDNFVVSTLILILAVI
jgi:hypothetical protein